MVKLDVKVLRYLSKEDFRCLTAIEMGMKNHEMVPVTLINQIAKLKFGGAHKSLEVLHKNKLVWHSRLLYEGYRLTYGGYDFLAIKALTQRGVIAGVGTKVGVGKESDVYICINEDEKQMIMKLHRLGRTTFKTIKENRDYHQHRKNASWLYLSRLAALKEYAYMKALYDNGFPVPTPVDVSRHCVIMSVVDGYPLCQVRHLRHPGKVYNDLMNLILRLASYGLIHGDFNEFNLLISDTEVVTLIDFPQMVSTSHPNAEMYFDRDVTCVRVFFQRKFGYETDSYPTFKDCVKVHDLDVLVAASGFTKEYQEDFDELSKEQEKTIEATGENAENEGEEDEDSEEEVETTQKQFAKVALAEPTAEEEGEENTKLPEKIDNRKKAPLLQQETNGKQPDTNHKEEEITEQANEEAEEDKEEPERKPIVIDQNKIAQTVKLRLEKKHSKSNVNTRKRNTVKSKAKKAIREQVSGGY